MCRYDGMHSDGSSMPAFLVASNYFFTALFWAERYTRPNVVVYGRKRDYVILVFASN